MPNLSQSARKPPPSVIRKALLATDWKAFPRNTLKGFFTLITPGGLRIKECMLHEKTDKRWVGLPAKPWTKEDGSVMYVSILDFETDEARIRFQREALAAIDELLLGVHPS